MGIIKEFKEFAIKGNLVDMTVAFIIGAAFTKVVTSFIQGMVMPLIGKVTAGVDFKSLKYVLTEAQHDAAGKEIVAEASIKYGEFIAVVLDFLLVAVVMFMVIKAINKMKRKQEETPVVAEPTKEEILLAEIRDLLKNKTP
ncbi:MAG: mscL [Bacteroidetes bacterium]|nr:mscL [Bacteroidota bacterium]